MILTINNSRERKTEVKNCKHVNGKNLLHRCWRNVNCLTTDVGGMLFMLMVFKTSAEGIASKTYRKTITLAKSTHLNLIMTEKNNYNIH